MYNCNDICFATPSSLSHSPRTAEKQRQINRMEIRTLPLATCLLLRRPKSVRNSLQDDSDLEQMNQVFMYQKQQIPHTVRKWFFMRIRWGRWQSCHDLKTTRITRIKHSLLQRTSSKRETGGKVREVQTGYPVRLCSVTRLETETTKSCLRHKRYQRLMGLCQGLKKSNHPYMENCHTSHLQGVNQRGRYKTDICKSFRKSVLCVSIRRVFLTDMCTELNSSSSKALQ